MRLIVKDRLWELRDPPDPRLARRVSREFGLHPLVASLLLMRFPSQDVAEMHRTLYGDLKDLPFPEGLGDLPRACKLLTEAVIAGVPIGIFGDYDVDGITATVILWKFLKECGAKLVPLLPSREEGYGLNAGAVRHFAAQGVRILLTLDNGIAAHKEIRQAVHLGMRVIVCDHHHFDPARLPEADALVHPALGSPGAWREVSGAGVALAVAIALRKSLREQGFFQNRKEPQLREALALAALGTLADLVPLRGVNRLIVREGLKILRRLPEQALLSPGLCALMEVSGVKPERLQEDEVLFYLAPRINAAGRIEDAHLALALLLSRDPSEAQEIARRLNRLNSYRQALEEEILKEAKVMIETHASLHTRAFLLLLHPSWHPGVLGIVAGRIAQHYYRPALLLTLEGEEARGSGRSIPEVNLIEALRAGEAYGEMGGHPQAAGVRIPVRNLPRFQEAVEEHLHRHYAPHTWQPRLLLDQEFPTAELTPELVEQLMELGPFGVGNPRPLLLSEAVQPERVFLHERGHLRFQFRSAMRRYEAIAFRRPDLLEKVRTPVRLAYRPVLNEYNGRVDLRIEVEDLRSAWM